MGPRLCERRAHVPGGQRLNKWTTLRIASAGKKGEAPPELQHRVPGPSVHFLGVSSARANVFGSSNSRCLLLRLAL